MPVQRFCNVSGPRPAPSLAKDGLTTAAAPADPLADRPPRWST